ncbi:MAG: peptidylprolyl isomerase [Gammaproteobacteria bacterium]|nr:peptidylprolyl isomerase [Pseudomonadales bacterium]MCP5346709.1 peptidylprolyl isomerase [Pseudomonadales bacterium]
MPEQASTERIRQGSQVTLYFSLALPDGELIDSNFDRAPATFQVGDGNMLPGFEQTLLGLQEGDEVEVRLPPGQAFGELNSENVHRIARDRFTQFLDEEYEELQPGTVVSFKDPAGFDLPGVIKEKFQATVVVDFNHPLAGKEILFRARIVRVMPAGTRSVEVRI